MPAPTKTIDDVQFAAVAKALADPNRVEILRRIGAADDMLACSDIRERMEIAPATLSHHMKELEHAGLIRIERNGKFADLHLRRDVLKAYRKRLAAI